ncbi:acyl-CoA carboxylase subunit epsilon [Streptomyces sp. NPDC051940]|uniref:acyl-CoA carboxylase subunit epsilon n=1 Tax=Streptomyces sp. NPDC051940 TaxID=3155675 RepID=UPI0034125AC1
MDGPEPLVRFIRGEPDPVEIAAVTLVLITALHAAGDQKTEATLRRLTTWSPSHGWRPPASWSLV